MRKRNRERYGGRDGLNGEEVNGLKTRNKERKESSLQ